MNEGLQRFLIEMPQSVDEATVADIEKLVAATPDVIDISRSTMRSVDMATVGLLVGIVGGAITAIKQVVDLLKRKGVKAKLVFADGSVIEADEISAEDLRRLLEARK